LLKTNLRQGQGQEEKASKRNREVEDTLLETDSEMSPVQNGGKTDRDDITKPRAGQSKEEKYHTKATRSSKMHSLLPKNK